MEQYGTKWTKKIYKKSILLNVIQHYSILFYLKE